MKKYERSRDEYVEAAKNSLSVAQMCKYLGRNPCGAGYYMMKKKIEEYNIDTSHFLGRGWNKGLKYNPNEGKKRPLEEILVENSTYVSSFNLKNRLIKEGLKNLKCEKCGREKWEGEDIPLQLHHINGCHNDNRINNLQLLCPNCHALTENYCGKNKRK